MPVRLTKEVVKTVDLPAKGYATLWDGTVTGFGLRISAHGAKSFFLNYRINGRERRHTIGSYPTWSVEAAREEAKGLRRRVDSGSDPAGEKRERREAPTVQDLVDRYIAEHLPTKTAGGPRANIAEQRANDETKRLGKIVNHLGKHARVADIHAGDLKEMHRKISKSIGRHGPRLVRANRILAIASKMFALSLVPMAGENKPWRDHAAGN